MSLAFLAEIVPGGTSIDLELAAATASAIPVIGGIIVGTTPREISRTSNKFLRLNLWLAFAFRVLGVLAFVIATVTGVFGLTNVSNTIITLLSSAAVASIGQLIDRSARRSQSFALSVEQMDREDQNRDKDRTLLMQNLEAIEDPGLRDSTRSDVAKRLARSITAPTRVHLPGKSQDEVKALESGQGDEDPVIE